MTALSSMCWVYRKCSSVSVSSAICSPRGHSIAIRGCDTMEFYEGSTLYLRGGIATVGSLIAIPDCESEFVMATALIVPAALEKIVQYFNAKEEPFTGHDVAGALRAASAALKDPSEPERNGAWAEYLAFALATDHHENPWNSYFGPMGSGEDGKGDRIYFPDIVGTPRDVVPHWANRARTLKHPFLKARYADLAWEMSGPIGNQKRNVEDARVAIDSYLDAVPRMAEDHEHVTFTIRALDLAVLIGDKGRTDRARIALMEVHREIRRARAGMWWYTVDRLLEDKKAGVSDAERAELIADLESIVATGSNSGDPAHFNPHEAKDAAERLIPYYRRLGKFDDIRRLHKA